VTDSLGSVLWRVNPLLDQVGGTVQVGFGVNAVAAGDGAVWTTVDAP
jgi:hypothetical protein